MATELKLKISETFTDETKKNLYQSILFGYELTNKVIQEYPFLKSKAGYDAFPHIRRAAVDYSLRMLVNRVPRIQCTADYKPNKSKNCSHLELNLGCFVITANYVEDSEKLPRDAIFRDNLCDLNLPLFGENSDPEKIYCVITHGGNRQFPKFIALKIPGKGFTHTNIDIYFPTVQTYTEFTKAEDTDFDLEIEFNKFKEDGLQDAISQG
ncbi:hypothetical protein EHR01_19135 [Leptospira mtsangambouensis]|uniref:Uncharacterized protein n=1 Tax=Leptospira mtsangambouensis TaxID=2484912 RepID=A0ABY2NY06_9LEPT|nr:hypothetical protein [Leptospira mtsangambouensis]TGM73307.1 hypothetical protein EHR01_19135 [Leptospira mtsangambouensis]